VNPTPPSITRRPAPSPHSDSQGGSRLPEAILQHPRAPTERLDRPPFALAEKTLLRRLHRNAGSVLINQTSYQGLTVNSKV
jgi:hypothetical protein